MILTVKIITGTGKRKKKKTSRRKNKDVMKHNFINVNSQPERKIVCSQINEGVDEAGADLIQRTQSDRDDSNLHPVSYS